MGAVEVHVRVGSLEWSRSVPPLGVSVRKIHHNGVRVIANVPSPPGRCIILTAQLSSLCDFTRGSPPVTRQIYAAPLLSPCWQMPIPGGPEIPCK